MEKISVADKWCSTLPCSCKLSRRVMYDVDVWERERRWFMSDQGILPNDERRDVLA